MLAILFASTSCKKCMTCSPICYKCVQGTYIDTLCGGGITTAKILQQQVAQMEQYGYTCTQYNPGQSYQYCDGNQSLTTYLQNSGLLCQ